MTTTPASSWWARSTDRSMMSKKFGPHTRRVTTSIGAWTAQMVRPYFFARSRGAVADWVSGSRVTISSTDSNPASAMVPKVRSRSHIQNEPVEQAIAGRSRSLLTGAL